MIPSLGFHQPDFTEGQRIDHLLQGLHIYIGYDAIQRCICDHLPIQPPVPVIRGQHKALDLLTYRHQHQYCKTI